MTCMTLSLLAGAHLHPLLKLSSAWARYSSLVIPMAQPEALRFGLRPCPVLFELADIISLASLLQGSPCILASDFNPTRPATPPQLRAPLELVDLYSFFFLPTSLFSPTYLLSVFLCRAALVTPLLLLLAL